MKTTLLAAGALLAVVSPVSAATYQIDELVLPCTLDCRNIRGGALTDADVVTLNGTFTTDSDAGAITVDNITGWDLTFTGPENGSTTYNDADEGAQLAGPPFPITLSMGLLPSNAQIVADGTNFSVSLVSPGPNSTVSFNWRANFLIDFGFGPIAGGQVAQASFLLTTDDQGVQELHRSLVHGDINLQPAQRADSGVDRGPPPAGNVTPAIVSALLSPSTTGVTILTGTVVPVVSAVPLPAGGLLLLGAFGGLAALRRKGA